MTFCETLESKIYLAEDAVCRRSGELDRHLHELESRLKDLTAAVHRVRRESMSLGARSSSIVRAVEAFEAGTALWEIREEAERITSLRGSSTATSGSSPRAPGQVRRPSTARFQ